MKSIQALARDALQASVEKGFLFRALILYAVMLVGSIGFGLLLVAGLGVAATIFLVSEGSALSPALVIFLFLLFLAATAFLSLLVFFVTGAGYHVVAVREQVGVGEAFQRALKRGRQAVYAIMVLYALLLFAYAVVFAASFFTLSFASLSKLLSGAAAAGVDAPQLVSAFTQAVLPTIAVIVLVSFFLAPFTLIAYPVILLENVSWLAALKRIWRLGQEHYLGNLFYALAYYVIVLLPFLAIELIQMPFGIPTSLGLALGQTVSPHYSQGAPIALSTVLQFAYGIWAFGFFLQYTHRVYHENLNNPGKSPTPSSQAVEGPHPRKGRRTARTHLPRKTAAAKPRARPKTRASSARTLRRP